MANNGAVSKTLNAGQSYTIPAGYHNGSGKVTANSLASQTSATATASDIANGKTAWVNGQKITGSALNNLGNAKLISNKTTSAVTVPAGYDYILVVGTRNTPLNYDPSISVSSGTALLDLTFKGGTLTIQYEGAWSTFNSMTICKFYKINGTSVTVSPVVGNKGSTVEMYVYAF